jgi:small conductance mechanosensitive channel
MPLEQLQSYVDLQSLLTHVIEWLPKLFVAILLLVTFVIGSKLSRKPLSAALRRTGLVDALIKLLVDKIYHYAVLSMGLVMALDQLGVNVAAALAGLGIAGIAVGFAAQDTLSNVISGITIFLDKPFEVGDWIKTADVYGEVSEITLRTTRIRTKRNTWIVIPNRAIIDSVLENHSKRGEVRVDVPVGIAYKEDIDRTREVLLEAIRPIAGQCSHKAAEVAVVALGNSSVDLQVRVWIDEPGNLRPTEAAIVEASKKALDSAGIEIPFPHLQLFVDEVRPKAIEQVAQLRALPSTESDAE